MTQEVSDEKLGKFSRQQNDWFRRVREGSLDPDEVAQAVQQIINRRSLEQIRVDIYNAYRGDLDTARKDVLGYIMMVVGMGSPIVDRDGIFEYMDPSGKRASIRIDEKYVNLVEERMGHGHVHRERKEAFRRAIGKIYLQKPNYDFMDNSELVKAVTDVRLELDFGDHSLATALGNLTNETNVNLYRRIIIGLMGNGYKPAEAEEAVMYYCTGKR